MDYQEQMKWSKREHARRELAVMEEEEAVYQQRVEAALARTHTDKVHPRRLLGQRALKGV